MLMIPISNQLDVWITSKMKPGSNLLIPFDQLLMQIHMKSDWG